MAEIDALMARRVRMIERAANGETDESEDDEDDENFGLFYPQWYVYDTWVEHEEHGLYPREGGYDNQDSLLMLDWQTLDRRYGKAVRERGNGGGNGNDIMDTLSRYNRKPETDMSRLIE